MAFDDFTNGFCVEQTSRRRNARKQRGAKVRTPQEGIVPQCLLDAPAVPVPPPRLGTKKAGRDRPVRLAVSDTSLGRSCGLGNGSGVRLGGNAMQAALPECRHLYGRNNSNGSASLFTRNSTECSRISTHRTMTLVWPTRTRASSLLPSV